MAATDDPLIPKTDSLELLSRQPSRTAVAVIGDNTAGAEVLGKEQVVAVVRIRGRLVGKDLMFLDKRVVANTELSIPLGQKPPIARVAPTTSDILWTPFLIQRIYAEDSPAVDLLLTPVSAMVVGTFNGLDPGRTKALKPGLTLAFGGDPDVGSRERIELLDVQPPGPATAALSDNIASGLEIQGRQQVVAAVRLHATPGR